MEIKQNDKISEWLNQVDENSKLVEQYNVNRTKSKLKLYKFIYLGDGKEYSANTTNLERAKIFIAHRILFKKYPSFLNWDYKEQYKPIQRVIKDLIQK